MPHYRFWSVDSIHTLKSTYQIGELALTPRLVTGLGIMGRCRIGTLSARLATFLLPLLCVGQLLPGADESTDFFCGKDWQDAHLTCDLPCPSGNDADCPQVDDPTNMLLELEKRLCFAAVNCFERFHKVQWTGVVSLLFERAALSLDDGTAADMMTFENERSFTSSLGKGLLPALGREMNQISLDVNVKEKDADRPCVAVANGGGGNPVVTSVDMVVKFEADYLPGIDEDVITEAQFGEIVVAAVRANPQSLADVFREGASTPFFDAVVGILAIDKEDVAAAPSSMPSAAPSRSYDQTFNLRIKPRSKGSYGLVFSVQTHRCGDGKPAGQSCGTILLTV